MKHIKTSYKCIAALLCLTMLLPLAACGETKQSQREIFAMDTIMTLTAYGNQREAGLDAAQSIIQAMDVALARARQAVEIVPESSELAFTLGSLLDSLGKRDEAMKVMQGIIASHPEHYQALNYEGYSLAVQGKDLEHALELLQRADRLAPDQFFIVDSLAWALFRLGRTEEALQNIRRAVALVPSPEAEILEHYGDIAAAAGQKEEARKAYEQALKLKPANAESLRQRLGDL